MPLHKGAIQQTTRTSSESTTELSTPPQRHMVQPSGRPLFNVSCGFTRSAPRPPSGMSHSYMRFQFSWHNDSTIQEERLSKKAVVLWNISIIWRILSASPSAVSPFPWHRTPRYPSQRAVWHTAHVSLYKSLHLLGLKPQKPWSLWVKNPDYRIHINRKTQLQHFLFRTTTQKHIQPQYLNRKLTNPCRRLTELTNTAPQSPVDSSQN